MNASRRLRCRRAAGRLVWAAVCFTPPENVCYGQTKVCSEVGRLVEATDPLPARMQRHGHHTIGVAQHGLAV